MKTDAVSVVSEDDFHPLTNLSPVPVRTDSLLAPVSRTDRWTSFTYEGMGESPSDKENAVSEVWTVRIWIILKHPQNLYGSPVFRMVKTILAILFPAAVNAFLWGNPRETRRPYICDTGESLSGSF